MRRLLSIFAVAVLCCISIAPSYAQRPKAPERQALSDTDYDFSLYGNVSSIKVSSYDLVVRSGVESKGEFWDSNVMQFTPRGDLSKATIYFGEGVLCICTYFYDQQGRLISAETHDAETGSYEGKSVFKYGANNKASERIVYERNGSISYKDKYTYDAQERLLSEATYFDGKLSSKTVNTYGSNGLISRAVVYDEHGKKIISKEWKYDGYKNLIRFTSYDEYGNKSYEETYKYDSRGYMISSTEQSFDEFYETENTYKYKYDAKGNVIERRTYSNDSGRLEPLSITIYTINYR